MCHHASPGLPHPASSPEWWDQLTQQLASQPESFYTDHQRTAHLRACRPRRGPDLTAVFFVTNSSGQMLAFVASGTVEKCWLYGWVLVYPRWYDAVWASLISCQGHIVKCFKNVLFRMTPCGVRPFILTCPKHSCAVIMSFKQRVDMPHLSGGSSRQRRSADMDLANKEFHNSSWQLFRLTCLSHTRVIFPFMYLSNWWRSKKP